jgi:hypothetical protein
MIHYKILKFIPMKRLTIIIILMLIASSMSFAQLSRGRVQKLKGTLVTDSGTLLRAPWQMIWEVTQLMPTHNQFSNLRRCGFNAIHLYVDSFHVNGKEQEKVDSIVKWAYQDSIYVIIVPSWCPGHVDQEHYDMTIRFWQYYAPKYADSTYVIYEINNEPSHYFPTNKDPVIKLEWKMERDAYKLIRDSAPETHIIFFSYGTLTHNLLKQKPSPWKELVDSDINEFHDIFKNDPNISIGTHVYGMSTDAADSAVLYLKQTCIDSSYALICTEMSTYMRNGIDCMLYPGLLKIFETDSISYFLQLTLNDIQINEYYKDIIEDYGITWDPDFGTWPSKVDPAGKGRIWEADKRIEGEWFDKQGGDVNGVVGGGASTTQINDNDSIVFEKVDFKDGFKYCEINYSGPYNTSASVEIFVDAPGMKKIGECYFDMTGRNWGENITTNCMVEPVKGIHLLYFKFHASFFDRSGSVSVDWFKFSNDLVAGKLQIPKCTSPPKLDGIMDTCWSYSPAMPLMHYEYDKIRGCRDTSSKSYINHFSTFRLMWDDDSLYLFAHVIDDKIQNNFFSDGLNNGWNNNDAFELWIDGGNIKANFYTGMLRHFRWTYGIPDTSYLTIASGFRGPGNWAWKRTALGYDFELRIPKDTLSFPWVEGFTFGLEVRNEDCDEKISPDGCGLSINATQWWSTSLSNWDSQASFGTAILSGTKRADSLLEIPKTTAEVVLDGEMGPEEWAAANELTLEKFENDPKDKSILSSWFDHFTMSYTMWDDNYFYVFVKVIDDSLYSSELARPWLNDRVELFFDGGNEKKTSYDTNDVQWRWVYRIEDNNTSPIYDGLRGPGEWVWKKTSLGYNLELKIPVQSLTFPLKAGQKIGFEITNGDRENELDTATNVRRWWSCNSSTWNNPSLLGTAVLSLYDPGQFTIKKTDNPPLINGSIDNDDPWSIADWVDLTKNGLQNTSSDITAKMQLMYDDKNLYMITQVAGDKSLEKTVTSNWENDCIEVFFSMNFDKYSTGDYTIGDYQLRMRRDTDYLKCFDVRNYMGEGDNSRFVLSLDFKVKQLESNGFYTQEWQIPWDSLLADLNLPVTELSQFKYDEQVADNTGAGKTQALFWNSNADQQFHNTKYLSLVRLETPVYFGVLPSVPILVSPNNEISDQALSVILRWKADRAESYALKVSTVSDFSIKVIDESGIAISSKAVSGLSNKTKYYWCVSATNINGTSAWSDTFNFTTAAPAPEIPTLSGPVTGSINQVLNPVLTWNAANRATSYSLEVLPDSAFFSMIVYRSGINSTSQELENLEPGITYYWRVNATNGSGTSGWSETWDFTTLPTLPDIPVLSSPANNSANQPVNLTLRWNAADRADSYNLQVSTIPDISTPIINQNVIPSTSQSMSGLLPGIKYYWHVSATNAGGLSDWSPIWNFTTQTGFGVRGTSQNSDYLIYPNPANNILTIECSRPGCIVKIFSLEGRPIFITTLNEGVNKLDLSNVNGGIYFISIANSKNVIIQKLIKQ